MSKISMAVFAARRRTAALLAAGLLAALPAGAADALPAGSADDLRAEMVRISRAAQGRVGVATLLIESGDAVDVAGDERFPMLSVYKLPIAVAVLRAVDAGRLDLQQKVTVIPADLVPPALRSPLRDQHPRGGDFSLGELLRLTLVESDGSASDVMMRLAGGPDGVVAALRGLAAPDVVVANSEAEMARDPSTEYRNWSTPRAMVRLLRRLYLEHDLSPASHALLFSLMTATTAGPHRLKALLPPGTQVAHRTGSSETVAGLTIATNDVGIVDLPDGRHLIVAVFVSDSRADEATREAVIARLGRAAWDHAVQRDAAPPAATPARPPAAATPAAAPAPPPAATPATTPPTPTSRPPAPPREALRAEFAQAWETVHAAADAPVEEYERPAYRQARGQLLSAAERWAAAFLAAHPDADPRAVAADLESLAGAPGQLKASAVRLAGAGPPAVAVALDGGSAGGTFFVVAPAADGHVAVAWSIRPLAEQNFPLRNELGRWAYAVAGYHDGPLGGSVLPLPATRAGHPRFLVHAIAYASMGMEVPAQVSVWEWTGAQAAVQRIADYVTTYEIYSVEAAGDRVRIATKEPTATFYSCGSCDDPQGWWTLRVGPDGVSDLGHVFAEPLLARADDLLARIVRGQDAAALAAPAVVAALRRMAAGLRDEMPPPDPDVHAGRGAGERAPGQDAGPAAADRLDGFRSMLASWSVAERAGRRVLDLATDSWHVVLTFDRRPGGDYATAVTVL